MPVQIQIRKASDRNAVRRRIAFKGETEDGFATYHIKSRTAEGKEYSPVVDVVTGAVMCDCPHFVYRCTERKMGHAPTAADAPALCHHLQRAINEALRKARF